MKGLPFWAVAGKSIKSQFRMRKNTSFWGLKTFTIPDFHLMQISNKMGIMSNEF
jgi:hypothetical protein